MHPDQKPRIPHVTSCLQKYPGPVVAATDYVKLFADQIRAYVDRNFHVLGTDGYGRSDTRSSLRKHFEVNRYYVVIAALKMLADEGTIPIKKVKSAIRKYKLDPEKPNPLKV